MRITPVPPLPGTDRAQRTLVRALDLEVAGPQAIGGPELDIDAVYDVCAGAVILGYDHHNDRDRPHQARVWVVADEKRQRLVRNAAFVHLASVWGRGTRSALQRQLAAHLCTEEDGARARVVRLETVRVPNRGAARCSRCGGRVAAESGSVRLHQGRVHTLHASTSRCVPHPATKGARQ